MPAFTVQTRTAYSPSQTENIECVQLSQLVQLCKDKLIKDELILSIEILYKGKVLWDSSAEPVKNVYDLFIVDSPKPKPRYKINAPMITPASTSGKYIAWGHKENGEQIRTSHIVKIDIEAGTIETLNSIYEIL